MTAITKVCKYCGSEDVTLDAWAVWSREDQEWELEDTYDHSHCGECDGETTIIDKPIEVAAPEAAHVWASGVIEFRAAGAACPEGALPLPGTRQEIEGLARQAYDGKTLLVPGVPEAADPSASMDAVFAFVRRLDPNAAARRQAAYEAGADTGRV